jgi:hypothetical protein
VVSRASTTARAPTTIICLVPEALEGTVIAFLEGTIICLVPEALEGTVIVFLEGTVIAFQSSSF